VKTAAGSGTAGSADATGTAASFNGPWGISADALGNLYHADYTGKRIRRTTPAGLVTFIDSFSSFPPIATAIDPSAGHLYVSVETHRILRYVNKNAAKYPAEAPVYGPETDFPDATIVYAGTSGSGTTNATGTSARFNAPHGLHARGGFLYVADKGNNLIRKIDLSNAAVTTVTVTGGTLSAPEAVWVAEDETIYVACTGSDLIQKIATDGALSTVAGSIAGNVDGTGTAASFNDPRGLAMNARGELLVADSGNHSIRRISPNGAVRTIGGGSASGAFADGAGADARFSSPRGLVLGGDGLLYIADHGNHRIRRMNVMQPLITGAPASLAAFTADSGNSSAVQSFTFAGTLLEGPITVTAPSGFEVSTDGSSYAASVTSNEGATVSIRLAATAATGSLAGNLTLSSAQADTINIALSGQVSAYITPSVASLGDFAAQSGSASAAQSFTVAGAGFTSPLIVTAPAGFEVSTDNSTFSSSLSIPPNGSNIPSTSLYVRLASTAPTGAASGNLTLTSTSMSTQSVGLSGSVTAYITSSAASLGDFVAQSGSASAVQTLTIDGAGFTAPLTFNAPAGYEISTDGFNFASSATLGGPGGTIQSVLLDAAGQNTVATGAIFNTGSGNQFPNTSAFAALKNDGSVVTWGLPRSGGNSSVAVPSPTSNGEPSYISIASDLASNVAAVYSNLNAFAALKSDGSLVIWGDAPSGGRFSISSRNYSSDPLSQSYTYTPATGNLASNVIKVSSSSRAFAALKTDGSVVTWGDANAGGDSTAVADNLASNVKAVYSNYNSFAALKNDGSVVTWGSGFTGGDSTAVAGNLTSNVTAIYSNNTAFAALKSDGSVVTWGSPSDGGNSSSVANSLTFNVKAVYSNSLGFAALKTDGSVVTWGRADFGGDSASVANSLTSNVKAVYSNQSAFAALKNDGSVVTWGYPIYGGDSSSVAEKLSSGVTSISSANFSFAALKNDGSVVTWGRADAGGNSTAVAGNLTSNVKAVYSNTFAFAALKTDGSVVTWGDATQGGDSTAVARNLTSNVKAVYSNAVAFAALKNDGSVVTWGESSYGGTGGPANIDLAVPLTLHVRLASTAPLGAVAGNLTISSFGATTQSVALSGTVFVPSLSLSTASLGGFAAQSGSASAAQSFTVAGTGFTAPLSVTAPAGFEVSTDNSTFSSSLSIPPNGSNIPSTILYARLASTAPTGAASGNLTLTTTSMSTQSVALSGTVTAYITSSVASLGDFVAQSGSASAMQTLTIDGAGFTAPLTFNAPAGYEISTDGFNFASSATFVATLGVAGGTIQSVLLDAAGQNTVATGALTRTGSGNQFPNASAFAALKNDGSVFTWGNPLNGGDSSSVANSLTSNVKAVYSNTLAFAALKTDGSVVTWGNPAGGGDSSSVANSLTSNVKAVYSNQSAFAALKNDGAVVTWGDANTGGDSTAVADNLTSNVKAVYSNINAFAALKSDGSVVTWGPAAYGGNSSSVANSLSSGVIKVHSNTAAFAALKNDGSVVTWGFGSYGGDSSSVANSLSSGVIAVYSNSLAFAALKSDGSVVTWGSPSDGGDSSSVANSLTSNVKAVYSNTLAFAALKTDGSVVTWGRPEGGGDSSSVANSLSSGVTSVSSAYYSFAALKNDGSVVTWGESAWGGNSSSVANSLSSGVIKVYSNAAAFAALKNDGSVVTWGESAYGGNSFSVANSLSSGVIAVYSNDIAFAALKSDGSVITWGESSYGGTGGPANIGLAVPPTLPLTLHVRLAANAPAGAVDGNLTISTTDATTQTVALSGTVTDGPTYTHQELWRFANFGSYSSASSGADSADPDGDGLSNLLEYALGLDPNGSGVIPAVLALNGANLEYSYTRSTAAKDNGVTYQIEWSDTLEVGSWSTETVTQQITSTQGALETVKASVPAGTSGKRFLRLRIDSVRLQTP
jgi:alpha-tubulin suppressor-like RCC1 family protein